MEDVTLVVATNAPLQHELEMANTADDRTLDAVNDKKISEDFLCLCNDLVKVAMVLQK